MQVESPGAIGLHAERGPVVNQQVTDNGAKSTATVALVFGISSTVLSLLLLLFCWGIWNRYDLLRIYYDDLKSGLVQLGGNPHPHLPGESP